MKTETAAEESRPQRKLDENEKMVAARMAQRKRDLVRLGRPERIELTNLILKHGRSHTSDT